MKLSKTLRIAIATSIAATSIGLTYHLQKSQLFMPNEYKSIKKIVNQIAKNNDLGVHPITFQVLAGGAMKWYMNDLKICNKEDLCTFYTSLNPFKRYDGKSSKAINNSISQISVSNTHSLGQILYTDYIHVFQISGMILLVAMIGAIVLTFRQRAGVKRQSYIKQISRERSQGVEVLEVETNKGVRIDD